MTTAELAATIAHRIYVLRCLEYRAKRANALGLRITGWVLTQDEATGLNVWPGCWTGPHTPYSQRAPVKRIIPDRIPRQETA